MERVEKAASRKRPRVVETPLDETGDQVPPPTPLPAASSEAELGGDHEAAGEPPPDGEIVVPAGEGQAGLPADAPSLKNIERKRIRRLIAPLGAVIVRHLDTLGTAHEARQEPPAEDEEEGDASLGATTLSIGSGKAPIGSAALDAVAWGLHPHLRAAIGGGGEAGEQPILRFFPVQREIVPILTRADAAADPTAGDILLTAPTGSGKTLAYVLPAVNLLLNEAMGVRRLRVLALVPTRDLAHQVAAVFRRFTAGTVLRVFCSTGQTHIDTERAVLRYSDGPPPRIGAGASSSSSSSHPRDPGVDILVATPGRLLEHLESGMLSLRHLRMLIVDEADRMLADEFLDWPRRVRAAVYGGGAGAGTAAAADASASSSSSSVAASASMLRHERGDGGESPFVLPLRAQRFARPAGSAVGHILSWPGENIAQSVHDGTGFQSRAPPTWLMPLLLDAQPSLSPAALRMDTRPSLYPQLRTIVCSATLASNPRKLAALALHHPTHFVMRRDVGGSGEDAADLQAGLGAGDVTEELSPQGKRVYRLPGSLVQGWSVIAAGDKPLATLHLLRLLEGQAAEAVGGGGAAAASEAVLPLSGGASASRKTLSALVFTSSVVSAHRLARTLQLFGGLRGRVIEFSSTLSQHQRNATLAAVKAGGVSALIASDVAARGLDIEELSAVIQYDAPLRPKLYVHRVGRTARAGRTGLAYTLLTPEQAHHFRVLLARTSGGAPPLKETVTSSIVGPYAPRFGRVLDELREVLAQEHAGTLAVTKRVPAIAGDDVPPLEGY